MAGLRADARRNYALLLAVAEEAVATQGADASLEQIARTAGVGSGTVRRHFPTRQALLTAVFQKRVDTLCTLAEELAERTEPRAALLEWLSAVTAATTTFRGLAQAMARDPEPARTLCASDRLAAACAPLVDRARDDLAPGVTVADVLNLVTGIGLATEHHPDRATEAQRLLELTIAGVSPARSG